MLSFHLFHHQPSTNLFSPFLTTYLAPSRSVKLSVSQEHSNAILTWEEIPLAHRRGFLLGYNIYINNGSQLTLIGKCYFKSYICYTTVKKENVNKTMNYSVFIRNLWSKVCFILLNLPTFSFTAFFLFCHYCFSPCPFNSKPVRPGNKEIRCEGSVCRHL